jgi:acyl-CoA synthetase (NDP forming)
MSSPLRRLLSPRHIAVFGGAAAAEAIRQCRKLGFAGSIWPVHPRREDMEGLACYPDVASLPQAPDASFIAVPREPTIEVVRALAARGAGGAVCYASGFAEAGAHGAALQRELVLAAAGMPLLGPNCYGCLNYLDGVALWPDQHGGQRIERGVAIVTQSGNIGLNLTMQRRALPLAYLVTVGNKAGSGIAEILAALLDDARVSAIGLHIEGLDEVAAFSRVAIEALKRRIPIVALKSGGSRLGAQVTLSHTSSLAGPDTLYDALFNRVGIARTHSLSELLETLKLLHVFGALPGRRIISASCSGGEASLVADLAQPRDLELPAVPPAAQQRLHKVLGDRVTIGNPLDYHTYIWGDAAAQLECFSAMMDCAFDAHLLVLDFPRADRCRADSWDLTLRAFELAHQASGRPALVVSSLPEGLPEAVAERLLVLGIAPMSGLPDALDAITHAARIGAAQRGADAVRAVGQGAKHSLGEAITLDEWRSKQALHAAGLPVPPGELVNAHQAEAAAQRLGYPVVLKAVSSTLAHKTEADAVRLGIADAPALRAALLSMAQLSGRFLVERMVSGVVAELIVGARRDPQFGQALTLGAGGVLVEMQQDSATLLLPVSRAEALAALRSLRIWPLLAGYRGRPGADLEALLDAIEVVAGYCQSQADRLIELDVNPLLALPGGVLAVDALIRMTQEELAK